jgi:hypothetical protein
MDISAVITGERTVTARFDEWPAEFRDVIHEKMVELTGDLEAHVRAAAPVKSGRLQASIESAVRDYEQRIVGTVFTGLAYAPVIEFGEHKSVSVRGHEQRLSHAWARDISPIEVFVDPYSRLADVEAQFFMRAGLQSIEDLVVGELRAVIDQVSEASSHE